MAGRKTKLQELRPKYAGVVLRVIREDLGLTQENVADELGELQSYVSKYESGERGLSYEEVKQAAAVFGMTIQEFDEFYENSKDPPWPK